MCAALGSARPLRARWERRLKGLKRLNPAMELARRPRRRTAGRATPRIGERSSMSPSCPRAQTRLEVCEVAEKGAQAFEIAPARTGLRGLPRVGFYLFRRHGTAAAAAAPRASPAGRASTRGRRTARETGQGGFHCSGGERPQRFVDGDLPLFLATPPGTPLRPGRRGDNARRAKHRPARRIASGRGRAGRTARAPPDGRPTARCASARASASPTAADPSTAARMATSN